MWKLLAAISAWIAFSVSVQAELIVFQDGRAMGARGHSYDGAMILLDLGGGNAIGFPSDQVRAILDDELPSYMEGDRLLMAYARDPKGFGSLIAEAAAKHGLDPVLLESVIRAESGFDPRAVSSKGAQGLMQLMPATAAELEVGDPFDPHANVDGGARYLRALLELFGGDMGLALAAYNSGRGRVERSGDIPPIAETRRYVQRVLSYYNKVAGK
jgi:soluble lytic murein transglycosylase-like protein